MTYVPERMSGFFWGFKAKTINGHGPVSEIRANVHQKNLEWYRGPAEDLNCPQATGKVKYDPELRDARFELDPRVGPAL